MKRRVYLDYNATTPVRPPVFVKMSRFLTETFGNPASMHEQGQQARMAVDDAREDIAELLGARTREIMFTSCGSESDNLAIIGAVRASDKKEKHIITTSVEHPAVLESCKFLEREGCKVSYLPVDRTGLIDIDDFKKSIRKETVLASVIFANNEVGTIQPIDEIDKICSEQGILFHTDAVQAVGKMPVRLDKLSVDLLSISGHKIGGPKGVGALFIREGTKIQPMILGDDRERGLRAGTENVPGIVGLAEALRLADEGFENWTKRMRSLWARLWDGIQNSISDVTLNGHPYRHLANTLNVSFKGVNAESLVDSLNMKGVFISPAAACLSGKGKPSHVLVALGLTPEEAASSVRISLGIQTTEEDISYVLQVLPEVVSQLRHS